MHATYHLDLIATNSNILKNTHTYMHAHTHTHTHIHRVNVH